MRVLVIGAGGFTGSYLFSIIGRKHEAIGTSTQDKSFRKLDLAEFNETSKILKEIKPNAICLPAGITNLDYIEKNPSKSRKTNVLGTKNIADYCKENKCKLIFFSSDAIFDGNKGPYLENDAPNPASEYGRQKLEAENLVKELDDFIIIRTSSIYGWNKRKLNFVSRLIEELRNGKEVKAPIDQFYTPTYVIDLANASLKLIEKGIIGIYNISGPDFINRYDIAVNVCKIFHFEKKLIIPVKSYDLKQTAKRPKYGGLISKKAAKELGMKFKGLKEGLKGMRSMQNT
ncbi:SDR family oxidoreductase [Candidatus Woesearchaeota archaeon]|nr:SDR family oxidoreductase [Candidatus Woesearchaeota archaeon]